MTQKTSRNGRVSQPQIVPPAIPETPAATAAAPPAGKLRLLKVTLQPTFVLVGDDGSVQEIAHPVVEVKGVDWSTWSAEVFTDEALETLRASIVPAPPVTG